MKKENAMKELAVVTIVTERKGMIEMLQKQLDNAGIDFYVSYQDVEENFYQFCSAYNRVNLMYNVLMKLEDYKYIIFIDGWDTLFFGDKNDVINKIPKNKVLISAEKCCYPDVSIMNDIPSGGTPWRYANFGGIAGTRDNLFLFLEECKNTIDKLKIGMDQEIPNLLLSQGINSSFILDYNTQLFYCMLEDEGELINYGRVPLNSATNQTPNFIHFNGKSDSIHFLKEFDLYEYPIPHVGKVDYVICLPGNPSSGFQSLKVFSCILDLITKGKKVLLRSGYTCNIYHVRNICLSNKSFELEQVPFQDYCQDYDKIIWIDADNYIEVKDIERLCSHDVDIVAGWYAMAPKEACEVGSFNKSTCGLYADINKPWTRRSYLLGIIPTAKRNENGLIPAHYAGMGLMVIKKGVFEKIGFPWFESWRQIYPVQNFQMCEVVTDDDGFCQKAIKNGFEIWIDPEVHIGHEKATIH
jgi:hypothetical protein